MALKCVPLNPDWVGNTGLDMRAIYRRPNGDLTADLPLRRHNQWQAKGFEYVTLADASSLKLAAPWLMSKGHNPQEFVAGYSNEGATPWNVTKYLEGAHAADVAAADELKRLVDQFGVDAVEKITGKPVPERLKAEAAIAAKKAGAKA
jgi:hypothetical protein